MERLAVRRDDYRAARNAILDKFGLKCGACGRDVDPELDYTNYDRIAKIDSINGVPVGVLCPLCSSITALVKRDFLRLDALANYLKGRCDWLQESLVSASTSTASFTDGKTPSDT